MNMTETSALPAASPPPPSESIEDYRVFAHVEVAAILDRLCDDSVLLSLKRADGEFVTSMLWKVDAGQSTIGINADIAEAALRALLATPKVVVVAQLDGVKIQFALLDVALARDAGTSILACGFPHEMYRFQRREAFRVGPLASSASLKKVRHRALGNRDLSLRMLDVSIGGCSAVLPLDIAAPALGLMVNAVQVELDAETQFDATLQLRHVSLLPANARGVKLGFEFIRPSNEATRSLLRFIDETQKRDRLLGLD